MAREPRGRPAPKLVRETGIALVHKGERIRAEDDAQAELVADDTLAVVNYHFPVEIEVRGGAAAVNKEEIARYVYERLAKRLKETG
jgi:hypothetical protein